MKNFYQIFKQANSIGLEDTQVGVVIAHSTFENYDENRKVYASGFTKEFRNKEKSRLLRELWRLCQSKNESGLDSLVELRSRTLDRNQNEVYQVNFVHDIVSYFLKYGSHPEDLFEFLGKTAYHVLLLESRFSEYDKEKDISALEYQALMDGLHTGLEKRFAMRIPKG